MLNFFLPKFEYKNLDYTQMNNVSFENRSIEFEQQNKKYLDAGYTNHNSEYFQTFEVGNDVKDFCNSVFPRYSVSIIQQRPGQTLPLHDDTFYMFAHQNNLDANMCIRINIFLEDWQSGHYFEINDIPVLHWKRGDAIIIERDELHLSGNMGLETKYTMQVTGVKNELTRC